jgi:thiosulfate/3-mercaptopyruvate sulfurtransferase
MASPLISANTLTNLLAAGASVVVLDCSFDLADTEAGERSHLEGHIPGAQYIHLERDLSGPKTDAAGVFKGRHPLRSRSEYVQWMGRTGIAPGRLVVAYDRQGGMYAARAWWVLRWMGHADVAVLDGGLAAWQTAGGALTTEVSSPRVAPAYPDKAPALLTLGANALQSRLDEVTVIDARAPERFRGEVEPLDTVAGHIPRALNRFFKDNLGEDGRFKPAATLQSEFEALLKGHKATVVHQCGSGVTACHNLLAMEVAGFGPGTLYPGSWSEWSSDPSRPMTKGA